MQGAMCSAWLKAMLHGKQGQKLVNMSMKLHSVRHASSSSISGAMNEFNELSGVFAAICTPFARSRIDTIDYSSLKANMANWSSSFVDFAGFVVHGYEGEATYLSRQERFDMVCFMRSSVGYKKKLIVGCSAESTKETIEMCELMKNAGADYSLLLPPHYYRQHISYTCLLNYFTEVADKSPLPLIIHNLPSATQVDLPTEFVIELADHPNIVGMNESSGDIAKLACIGDQLNAMDRNDFAVMAGSARFMLDALRVGACGSITPLATVFSQQITDLYSLFLANAEADRSICLQPAEDTQQQQLQQQHHTHTRRCLQEISAYKIRKSRIDALNACIVQADVTLSEYGVAGLKAALDMFGLYGGPCRAPLRELNQHELANLRYMLQQYAFYDVDEASPPSLTNSPPRHHQL